MKLSVIMITYNHEKFIREAIEGVLMQICDFDFELIVSNDCSPDTTDKVVRDIKKEHVKGDKIKYFSHKDNLGMQPNFIFAFKQCQGKYIALCEGDDYWTDPLKLQKQVDFLEANPDYGLVFTNGKVAYSELNAVSHLIYNDNDTEKRTYSAFKVPAETSDIYKLASGNYIHTAGVVFRNWVITDGLPNYMHHTTIGDWPLHMKTASKGLIKYMNDDTFCYRVHARGVYSQKSKINKIKMALGQFAPMLNAHCFDAKTQEIIRAYCYKTSVGYLKNCRDDDDYKYFSNFIDTLQTINQQFFKDLINLLLTQNKSLKAQNVVLKKNNYYVLKKRIKRNIKQLFS